MNGTANQVSVTTGRKSRSFENLGRIKRLRKGKGEVVPLGWVGDCFRES